MNEQLREYIEKYLALNGISAADDRIALLTDYLEILLETNKTMNLTAIRDPEEAALKHIVDCALIKDIPVSGTLLDVGSGGGLPAVPLAILRPELTVTALDSTNKKVTFIADTAKKLGLTNLRVLCGRAEELARTKERGTFDNVTARAVANMTLLSELCLPLVKKGGLFIAMKGKTGAEETAAAKSAVTQLGGRILSVKEYFLNGENDPQSRVLVTVAKIALTPETFPRSYARMMKKPL